VSEGISVINFLFNVSFWQWWATLLFFFCIEDRGYQSADKFLNVLCFNGFLDGVNLKTN
jgi:hypothetical protein